MIILASNINYLGFYGSCALNGNLLGHHNGFQLA